MEENRLNGFKRKRDECSDQVETGHHATSLLLTPPRIQDSFLPGEPDSEIFSSTMNYSEMLASETDDCISEALPHTTERMFVPHRDHKSNDLENQSQILADRVQSSIENLRLFYERLSSIVGSSEGSQSHGDSKICRLPIASTPESHVRKISGEGSSLVSTQEPKLAPESPVCTQGGESKLYNYNEHGKRSDLKDLLTSLQFLLSVVKKHEEMQRISQSFRRYGNRRKLFASKNNNTKISAIASMNVYSPLCLMKTVHEWLTMGTDSALYRYRF